MTTRPAHKGRLRLALDAAADEHGLTLKELTVLSTQHDPYRLDTPAGRRDGRWFAEHTEAVVGGGAIHLRGLHYAFIGQEKPNGEPYTNTNKDWTWLQERAAKAARWLGYIPFERILDARNATPVVQFASENRGVATIVSGIEGLVLPTEIDPQSLLVGFRARQPFRLVIIGEKTSLGGVLSPLAREYGADLYLPTGEPSDTMIYDMAGDADRDGRPLVVFYLADCDPSGWQMPISVARKLQAARELAFPGLRFQVHRVGLTPTQVRSHGLPSTPLTPSETRANTWAEETGVEQTEIDALATLRPDVLEAIVRDAVDPFIDGKLDGRVQREREAWKETAQQAIDAVVTDATRQAMNADLATADDALARIEDTLTALRRRVVMPDRPDLPRPVVDVQAHGTPLVDSDWSFIEQTRALKADKEYRAAS